MAVFHGQTVDFIGMVSDSLESPLAIEGNASLIEVGSSACSALGPKCVKLDLVSDSSAHIVDSQMLVSGRQSFSVGIAYKSPVVPAPENWGEIWTLAIQIFGVVLGSPRYSAYMVMIDGQCRLRQMAQLHSRVIEAWDMSDFLETERCIDIEDATLYWATLKFVAGGTCQLNVYLRGTGTLVGSKSWEWSGEVATPSYMMVGPTGPFSLPQSIYLTDLVVDYTNAQFPLRDYIPTYQVSFNSMGGSAVNSQTIELNGLVSEPTNPTRNGYSFGGWFTEEALTTQWNFSTNTITSARTLYAKWNVIYVTGTGKWSITLNTKKPSISLGGK